MGFAKPTESGLPRQGIASPGGDFPKQKASESILRELGNRVRKLRKERQFSQEQFAELCGLHRTAIGLIERGESNSRAGHALDDFADARCSRVTAAVGH